MKRLFAVLIIVAFWSLIPLAKVNAVIWTCYAGQGQTWQMEQPEGYNPTWQDCLDWRYGNPTPTPTPSPSETTQTPTPEPTPTPTETPSPTPTPEPTPSETPTPEPSPTPESTPEPTPTETPTPEPQAPPQPQPESTPTPTPEVTTEPEPEPEVEIPTPEPTVEEEVVVPIEPTIPEEEPLSEEVVAALQLFDNPSELFSAIFTDPGQVLTALGNIGADMSDPVREKAQETIVAAVIVGQISANAAVSASLSTRKPK